MSLRLRDFIPGLFSQLVDLGGGTTVDQASGSIVLPAGATITGQRGNVISGQGATVALTAAQSGSRCLFDRAAGIVYTLPAASVGLSFEFFVPVSVTSNAHKVITKTPASEFLTGSLMNIDTDSSNAVAAWTGDGATHVSVSMNGTTTGGLQGTWIRFSCISSALWLVTGVDEGNGTVATPFSTS